MRFWTAADANEAVDVKVDNSAAGYMRAQVVLIVERATRRTAPGSRVALSRWPRDRRGVPGRNERNWGEFAEKVSVTAIPEVASMRAPSKGA